jgi:hypothetical protein
MVGYQRSVNGEETEEGKKGLRKSACRRTTKRRGYPGILAKSVCVGDLVVKLNCQIDQLYILFVSNVMPTAVLEMSAADAEAAPMEQMAVMMSIAPPRNFMERRSK